jgi:hypothetical protein
MVAYIFRMRLCVATPFPLAVDTVHTNPGVKKITRK